MKTIKFYILLSGMICLVGCNKPDEISLETVESVAQEQVVTDCESGDKSMVEPDVTKQGVTEEPSHLICVYVCGAVKNPGVYELEEGSRVCDGIQAAGGLTEEAVGEVVNQARRLQDEEQIYIPTQEDIGSMEEWNAHEFTTEHEKDSVLVNINTADEKTLCTLPGVGETRAEAIINYREEHGNFGSVEEIMNVEGIKNGLFSKLESLITVQ